jgi:phage terminase large subunit
MKHTITVLPAQAEFLESKATHTAYIGGFGSGKSTAGILKTIKIKLENPGKMVAYYLPTYQLIKDIAFPKFSEILSRIGIKFDLNISDKQFITPYGKIIMRSLENTDLIIGYEVCYSCIDEADVLPTDKMKLAFAKIIARNRLNTKDGLNMTDMVGTPEGFGFAYDYFVKNTKLNRRLIKVKTSDNSYISQNYIDTLTETYTVAQLQAYLNGEFVNLTSGRVYTNFDRKENHTNRSIAPGDILHIGMDFNITNMAAVVHVIDNDVPFAVAEITKAYDTAQMISMINSRYTGHKIIIYPDASGANRTTSGKTDIQLLMEAGYSLRAPNKNPFVRDRVNSMNLRFLNNKGQRRYFVNTFNCPEYTEALEQISYKNNEPDKDGGLDHITDAGGYFIYIISQLNLTL